MHSSGSHMVFEVTVSYSATYFTRYLNYSEIPAKLTKNSNNAEIARLIHIVVRPILLIMGTVQGSGGWACTGLTLLKV